MTNPFESGNRKFPEGWRPESSETLFSKFIEHSGFRKTVSHVIVKMCWFPVSWPPGHNGLSKYILVWKPCKLQSHKMEGLFMLNCTSLCTNLCLNFIKCYSSWSYISSQLPCWTSTYFIIKNTMSSITVTVIRIFNVAKYDILHWYRNYRYGLWLSWYCLACVDSFLKTENTCSFCYYFKHAWSTSWKDE